MEKEPKNNTEEQGEEDEVSIPVVPGEVRFQPWPSIVLFHNITTSVKRLPAIEQEVGRPLYPLHHALEKTIEYRSKVKLHGMNVGITVEDISLEGENPKFGLKVQSRTQFISPTSGLANIISVKFPELETYFLNLANPAQFNTSSKILQSYKSQPFKKITFFGEWAGPGVQTSVAVTQIPHPCFFLFSIQIDDSIIFDPQCIADILTSDLSTSGILSPKAQSGFHDYFHIIPWFSEPFEFNFADTDSLSTPMDKINTLVDQIDQEDPYILQLFNIKGPGEGLVWFPTSPFLLENNNSTSDFGTKISRNSYSKFAFKTKGEKHRVVAAKKAVSIEPEKAANAKEYAKLMVTEQRCEQGIKDGKIELKKENVGKFLNWILTDVKKEGQDELKASGLDWKAAQKTVTEAARVWFMNKVASGVK